MGLYGGELIYLLNVLSLFTSEQQGSQQKKVPSGYLGLVNFLAGQVTFKAYLPEQVLQCRVIFSFGRILNSNHVWVIY